VGAQGRTFRFFLLALIFRTYIVESSLFQKHAFPSCLVQGQIAKKNLFVRRMEVTTIGVKTIRQVMFILRLCPVLCQLVKSLVGFQGVKVSRQRLSKRAGKRNGERGSLAFQHVCRRPGLSGIPNCYY
jgi:hypothetical protein